MTGPTETWQKVAEAALGWLHPAEGPGLARHADEAAAGLPRLPLVEIGGYAGKSACWLGDVARRHATILYSVDWHRGSPEMAPGRECHHPEMIGPDGRFDSLVHFRRNIADAGLEEHVVPIAGRSNTVGRHWGSAVSFLFIDGGHDDRTVMNDLMIWAPRVAYPLNGAPSGRLAFHDVPIPGIAAAVERAIEIGFKRIERIDDLQVLEWNPSTDPSRSLLEAMAAS